MPILNGVGEVEPDGRANNLDLDICLKITLDVPYGGTAEEVWHFKAEGTDAVRDGEVVYASNVDTFDEGVGDPTDNLQDLGELPLPIELIELLQSDMAGDCASRRAVPKNVLTMTLLFYPDQPNVVIIQFGLRTLVESDAIAGYVKRIVQRLNANMG